MSDKKDFITLAEEYASAHDPDHWYIVRAAVIHGYQLRVVEEQKGIAKLHERIKELETELAVAEEIHHE